MGDLAPFDTCQADYEAKHEWFHRRLQIWDGLVNLRISREINNPEVGKIGSLIEIYCDEKHLNVARQLLLSSFICPWKWLLCLSLLHLVFLFFFLLLLLLIFLAAICAFSFVSAPLLLHHPSYWPLASRGCDQWWNSFAWLKTLSLLQLRTLGRLTPWFGLSSHEHTVRNCGAQIEIKPSSSPQNIVFQQSDSCCMQNIAKPQSACCTRTSLIYLIFPWIVLVGQQVPTGANKFEKKWRPFWTYLNTRWKTKLHIWLYRFSEFLCLYEYTWTAPGEKMNIQFSSSQLTAMHEGRVFGTAKLCGAAGYELTSIANISPSAVLPAACKDVSWAELLSPVRYENWRKDKIFTWNLGDFHGFSSKHILSHSVVYIITQAIMYGPCQSMWAHPIQSSHSSFHMAFHTLYSMCIS